MKSFKWQRGYACFHDSRTRSLQSQQRQSLAGWCQGANSVRVGKHGETMGWKGNQKSKNPPWQIIGDHRIAMDHHGPSWTYLDIKYVGRAANGSPAVLGQGQAFGNLRSRWATGDLACLRLRLDDLAESLDLMAMDDA